MADIRLSKSDALPLVQSQSTLAGELLRSAAYAAFQQPLNGAAELVHQTITNKCPAEAGLIAPPQPADALSPHWYAQRTGQIAGLAATVCLTHRLVGNLSGRALSAMRLPQRFAFTGEAAISGALYGGVLTPVGADNAYFLRDRIINAGCGVGAFAISAKIDNVLQHRAVLPGVRNELFGKRILFHAGAGSMSNLSIEQMQSLMLGKGFLTPSRAAEAMFTLPSRFSRK